MKIRKATERDLNVVESLLAASSMSLEGVKENFSNFVVAVPRFGFARTTRSAAPAALKASAEFQGACPDTAVVMTRRISTAAPGPS